MIHRRTLQALISKINYDDRKELFLETVIISEPLQYRQHALQYIVLHYSPHLSGEENRGDQKNRKGQYERGRWKEQKNAR